ncbi:MAG: dihydrofolate reductase family protein, partial [Actinomycetota bacterium]|nr:dihydrofolate reductase family protein [Actinomycetota bacterium]
DGVLVGIGTVLQDDPELTVRMVPGASPMRIVLDSKLQLPEAAKVLNQNAATTVFTSELSAPERRQELRAAGVRVEVVDRTPDGIDLAAMLHCLRASGTESLLVEGGARVITSLLGAGLVDRIIVAVAPIMIGEGTAAVGPLGITEIGEGIRLENRSIFPIDDDVLLAWDITRTPSPS